MKVENCRVYNKRIVAFIDILGFQAYIKQSENNPDCAQRIKRVLNYIAYLKKDNDEGKLSLREIGKEVTVFSDSIVISYPYSLESSLFYLMIDIVHIQLQLVAEGFLFRGGIAIGELHHKGNIVFGPAMIQAYKLEAEYAIYPRIVMTEETIAEGVKNKAKHHSIEQELEYILGLVKKDIDGLYYIDFLKQYQELDEEHEYNICIDKIKALIEDMLNTVSDLKVRQKYEWLKLYYNLTISDVGIDKQYLIE